jgi:hypothetical protein
MKLIAGILAAVALIGWTTGAGAQTEPTPPPLPPAQGEAQPAPQQVDTQQQPPPQQAAAPTPTNNSGINFPPLPLGHGGVQEAQDQLIALGFDPGGADGEAGPATIAAAQQYNENRGGSGPVPVDAAGAAAAGHRPASDAPASRRALAAALPGPGAARESAGRRDAAFRIEPAWPVQRQVI